MQQLIEFLNLCKTSVGISKDQLKEKLNLSSKEIDDLFLVTNKAGIKINHLTENNKLFYILDNKSDWQKINLSSADILELAKPPVFKFLPNSIQDKVKECLPNSLFKLIQNTFPINPKINLLLNRAYELSYFSRKENSYEKRDIIALKFLRIGTQELLEAFCFKRKAIRWFEMGRIRTATEISNKTLPIKPNRYFKRGEIHYQINDADRLKWIFSDIIYAYNEQFFSIEFSEEENIKKELTEFSQIKFVKHKVN